MILGGSWCLLIILMPGWSVYCMRRQSTQNSCIVSHCNVESFICHNLPMQEYKRNINNSLTGYPVGLVKEDPRWLGYHHISLLALLLFFVEDQVSSQFPVSFVRSITGISSSASDCHTVHDTPQSHITVKIHWPPPLRRCYSAMYFI